MGRESSPSSSFVLVNHRSTLAFRDEKIYDLFFIILFIFTKLNFLFYRTIKYHFLRLSVNLRTSFRIILSLASKFGMSVKSFSSPALSNKFWPNSSSSCRPSPLFRKSEISSDKSSNRILCVLTITSNWLDQPNKVRKFGILADE